MQNTSDPFAPDPVVLGALDLSAEDVATGLEVEPLNDGALLGTWTSSSTVGSASCPGSTASSSSTLSCSS